MKAQSETPLDKSQRLASELTSDPVAAAMIKEHVSTVRLIELLELTEEDFYQVFPLLDDGK